MRHGLHIQVNIRMVYYMHYVCTLYLSVLLKYDMRVAKVQHAGSNNTVYVHVTSRKKCPIQPVSLVLVMLNHSLL